MARHDITMREVVHQPCAGIGFAAKEGNGLLCVMPTREAVVLHRMRWQTAQCEYRDAASLNGGHQSLFLRGRILHRPHIRLPLLADDLSLFCAVARHTN